MHDLRLANFKLMGEFLSGTLEAAQFQEQYLVGTWVDGTVTAYLNMGTPDHPSFANQQNIGAGWNNITKIATVH